MWKVWGQIMIIINSWEKEIWALGLCLCTVVLYCGVKCRVLHRGYVLKYIVEYIVTTSYLITYIPQN